MNRIRRQVPAIPNSPVNMYVMMGYCPERIFRACMPYAESSLTFAHDQSVAKLQEGLVGFVYKEIFGVSSKSTSGLVLHSGSEANEIAVLLAKRHTRREVVLSSNITHSSVANACVKLDMQSTVFDVSKSTLQLSADEVIDYLERHGSKVAMVNITFGSTHLGIPESFALDPHFLRVCRKNKIWIHIDAAYGGFILNLRGDYIHPWHEIFAAADSITVDPHKFVGTWGCGLLLLKDRGVRKLLGAEVSYFQGIGSSLGTSRSAFPAATAQAVIVELGRTGLQMLADECYTKAAYIIDALRRNDIPLLLDKLQSPNIPIATSSLSVATKLRNILQRRGFIVAIIRIPGRHYERFGVRIVITPRRAMTWKTIKLFTKVFVKTYKEVGV